MHAVRRWLASCLLASLCGLAHNARAAPASDQGGQPLPQTNDAPPSDWHLLGYIGGFAPLDHSDSGGVNVGASFRYRSGMLVGGAAAELGGGLFDYSYVGAGALGGFSTRPARNLRFELLGQFGAHSYSGVGAGFLSDDPGASGSCAFAGARIDVAYVFSKKPSHFELGLYSDFQDDLERRRVDYTYVTRGGWFDGDGTGSAVIGTSRLGFGIELGGTHDIL